MTAARVLGLLLIGGAVIAGTALDRVPVDGPARAGDQFVLAADFHVHAFVGDGGVPPWELGREARRRKLDVIVVSNHNQLLAARLAAFGRRLYGADQNALIIPAEELTTPGFHMIAAGITRTIDWRLPAAAGHCCHPRAGRSGDRRASGLDVLAGVRRGGETAARRQRGGASRGPAGRRREAGDDRVLPAVGGAQSRRSRQSAHRTFISAAPSGSAGPSYSPTSSAPRECSRPSVAARRSPLMATAP